MKGFKVRLWDKERKYMIYDLYYEGLFIQDDKIYFITAYNSEVEDWDDVTDRYESMLCTGLKDKKDKEIYDGDVLGLNKEYYQGQDDYLVEFGNGSFLAKSCDYIRRIDKVGQRSLGNIGTELYGVIGNIYENPNLLIGSD